MPKIADFGLAKRRDGSGGLTQLYIGAGLVRRVEFDRAGKRLLLLGPFSTNIFDPALGRDVASTNLGHAMFHSEFSPDGERVLTAATSDRGRVALVWEAATGRRVTPLLDADVVSAAFCPDGCRFVTLTEANTARVWDAVTGQPLSPVLRHDGPVRHGAFSPDGRRLATACDDQTARHWDATDGKSLTPPLRHEGKVTGVGFHPEGRWLLTVSQSLVDGREEGRARLWDTLTGQSLWPPLRHRGRVTHAEFTAHGTGLLTASADGAARLWRLPVAEQRPVAEVMTLAEVLSGQRLDPHSGAVALSAENLADGWQQLRSRYPADFRSEPGQLLSWHEREAEDAEASGQWFATTFHLDRLLAAVPATAVLHLRRGHARSQLGQWAAALADFDRALALRPQSGELWLERGLAHFGLGQHEQALTDLAEAQQRLSDRGAPLLVRALVQARQGRQALATAAYAEADNQSRAVALRPETLWGQHARGVAEAQRGPWELVLAHLDRALTLEPNANPMWRARGLVQAALGNYERAATDFGKAAAADATDGEAWHGCARAHAELGHLEPAAADLARALETKPNDWGLWFLHGLFQAQKREYAPAAAAYSRALELVGEYPSVRVYRAQARAELAQWSLAAADLEAARALAVAMPQLDYWLALTYLAEGRTAAYYDVCTRLLARCGQGEQGAWTNTAVWAACLAPGAEEVRDSCVRLAEKMVAAAPRSHSHVNTLGAALYRAGRHAAAAARLEEAVYLHGREGTGWDWYFLAMTYQRLGRGAEARQALEKARTWAEHAVQGTLDDPLTPLPLSWSQRLELQRLRREAEAVLGSVVVPVW